MKTNGPGRYDPECTELRERLKASGLVLIVRDGIKGEGFEVQLNALDLIHFPKVLREMADQIEAQLRADPPT